MAKTSGKPTIDVLDYSEEVAKAFSDGKPVLALESTIITHGMPFPRNMETALEVHRVVRDSGATPATIAIMDGKLKAGLSDNEIESLARLGPDAVKCSRRDIPFLVSQGSTGSTTVAATMIIASMAGIRVFATGGIGGVHRGAEQSMDISADLQELAKTSVAVICAGPKAILDIGLTLEYLETHGVPVIGYGTDELPAFYSRESGFGVDYRIDSAAEVAGALNIKSSLGLAGGVVIANPIPADAAMDRDAVDKLIKQAIEEADQQGIAGKDLTPYLLQRIEELSGGESLKANIALMLNNAKLGAEIAASLLIR
jgi:pseudouridine-5'-phosphate glycosidase